MATVDVADLERRVKDVYRDVALHPEREYHFEMGRALAERLGYPAELLDRVPAAAVDSFAGVGYFLDLASPLPGDRVLDLGSGSGTDTFAAATMVGPTGHVTGLDITDEQLTKADELRKEAGLDHVDFVRGHIESPPVADASIDLVVSNGVVNLSPDKAGVFREIVRVLVPGGRLALADIVTELELVEAITCSAELWASCIGGASQVDTYRAMIEDAGLRIEIVRENPYAFLSESALSASDTYGIKSVSLLAVKPAA